MTPIFRLATALMVVLFLSGCQTVSCLWAGNCSFEEVKDENNEPVVSKITGKPVMKINRQAKSVAVGDSFQEAISDVAKMEEKKADLQMARLEKNSQSESCHSMTVDQVLKLKADAQRIYLENLGSCQERKQHAREKAMLGDVIMVMAKGESDIQTLAKVFGRTVVGIEEQSTNKVIAGTTLGLGVSVSRDNRKSKESSDEALGKGIVAAAATGNTTVNGGISVDTGQTSSADSNDGGFASASSSETGTATGGSGSGSSTNTSTGNTVNLTIGDRNSFATAEDDGQNFQQNRETQNAEQSATQNQNNEGRQNGQITTDGNVDSPVNSDDDSGTLF